MAKFIAWFEELNKKDTATAGGKGANLGELARADLPVPPGFVVTAEAYLAAMEQGGVRGELKRLADGVDTNAPAQLEAAAATLRELVRKAGIPEPIRKAVLESYRKLGDRLSVAVRSSATLEDAADSSFAGMNESFTNVSGEAEVIDRLQRCWMSMWTPRVLSYRASRKITEEPAIAVVVQRMVAAERSGVMFTADPSTGDRGRVIIEGAFGQGEVVVSGQVEPDTYLVSKSEPLQVEVRIGRKTHKIVRGPDGKDQRIEISGADRTQRVLGDEDLTRLRDLGLRIERRYGAPQDVEWAIEGSNLFVVQSRPITTLPSERAASPGQILASGLGASPGSGSGIARVLRTVADGDRLGPGDVLVAAMTSPDWVPI